MASSELTFEQIYNYFKENGGVVKNRNAVSAFKRYLTDPRSKDDARIKFRQYINTLAHTKKGDNDEKYLVLKTKYVNSLELCPPSPSQTIPPPSQYDTRNSLGIAMSPNVSSSDFSPLRGSPRQPPPYRPPPPVTSSPSLSSHSMDNVSISSFSLDGTPLAPPRRRSVDKINMERTKSVEDRMDLSRSVDEMSTPKKNSGVFEEHDINLDDKQTMSVKEKTQKFNRLASCEDELSPKGPKSAEKKKGADEDDGASKPLVEQKKCVEWFVTASKGEYIDLVKLANAEPRLVKKKTVLHWGAKYGNEDIIKEFAGNYKIDVNVRTGYTPLHIAAQFGHINVYNLLKDTYKADSNIRDYSGKMAQYYFKTKEEGTEGHVIMRKKNRKKQSEKDLGFLRIGSLNVRVKKTTEAFSNFLGVGSGAITPMETMNEKVHKGWGSADNVTRDNVMGAPKGYVAKKKSKRPMESGMSSTPTTPKTPTKSLRHFPNDSDSDTAAGFDSNWKN